MSPSDTFTFSEVCLNFDKIPVILNSTFLEISPCSKPKYISSEYKLSDGLSVVVAPVQPKNWLIDLSE